MSFKEIPQDSGYIKPCHEAPPKFDCCPPCPDPCKQKCCPKTRIWDCIDVFPKEQAQRFELYHYVEGAVALMAAHNHCIELTIRQRGFCDPVVIIEPIRSELDGSVWFEWPDKFTSAPAGYYEADLRINDEMCHTFCFHKVGCWVGSQLKERQFIKRCEPDCESCSPDPCCHGNRPSPDFDDNYRSGCDVQCK